MGEIDYKFEQKGDIYIFRMKGTISAETLPRYRDVIDHLMEELGVSGKSNLKFIMDYGGIEDVDSSALANIVDRLKNDVRCDHRVAFINVPEKFKELVALFKMEHSIEVHDSQEEAEKALSS